MLQFDVTGKDDDMMQIAGTCLGMYLGPLGKRTAKSPDES